MHPIIIKRRKMRRKRKLVPTWKAEGLSAATRWHSVDFSITQDYFILLHYLLSLLPILLGLLTALLHVKRFYFFFFVPPHMLQLSSREGLLKEQCERATGAARCVPQCLSAYLIVSTQPWAKRHPVTRFIFLSRSWTENKCETRIKR